MEAKDHRIIGVAKANHVLLQDIPPTWVFEWTHADWTGAMDFTPLTHLVPILPDVVIGFPRDLKIRRGIVGIRWSELDLHGKVSLNLMASSPEESVIRV